MENNPILKARNFQELRALLNDFEKNPAKYDFESQQVLLTLKNLWSKNELVPKLVYIIIYIWMVVDSQIFLRGPVYDHYTTYLAPAVWKSGNVAILTAVSAYCNTSGFVMQLVLMGFLDLLLEQEEEMLFPVFQDFFLEVTNNINPNRNSVVTKNKPIYLNRVVNHPDYTY